MIPRRRKLVFATLAVAAALVLANAMAAAGIAAALRVAPWDRDAVLAAKRGFLRSPDPEFLPHPFVGQSSSTDVGTGGALAGREPLYAARPESLPARPVRVLVLGGSLAKHL